ncbi:hypothetical protein AB1Y20_007965 [Prymnesium parvum]|uniref:Amino acid transporter transmembrane domain-containing protein n=1 Tax=Prymnesium parvum TaxID=97485 RepID=A0AB34IVH5_PRYPA
MPEAQESFLKPKTPSMPSLRPPGQGSTFSPLLAAIPASRSAPHVSRGLAAGVALEMAAGTAVFTHPTPSGGSSSLRVVTFNCMCTALGTGILAVPHVLTEVGLLGGVLLLGVVWFLTERSAAYISAAADLTGGALYTEIVASAFGPAAGYATGIILVVYSFSSCIGSLVVLKQVRFPTPAPPHAPRPKAPLPLGTRAQLLPRVLRFGADSVGIHETEPLLAIALLLVPLSALPSMERLKFTSMASVMLQFIIVACVILAAISASVHTDEAAAVSAATAVPRVQPIPMISGDPLAWMRSAPIVAFAFQFHQNVPFLLTELRQTPADSKWPTKRAKLQAGVRVAGGICFSLYSVIAVSGTHAFGMSVDKNVLVSLSSSLGLELLPASLVAAVFLAMSMIMVCAFPLNAYGLRIGLHELVLGGGDETPVQRWVGSFMLVTVSSLVALAVEDLGVLFRVTGATTGVYIMFLLPSALLLRLSMHPWMRIGRRGYEPPSPVLSASNQMMTAPGALTHEPAIISEF